MGLSDIIFLILAVLSASFVTALVIAGMMLFQDFDFSKKTKIFFCRTNR